MCRLSSHLDARASHSAQLLAVTRILAECVGPTGTVVGLDINPEMLAVAPQPNIDWLQGSAVRMALPDIVRVHRMTGRGYR